MGNKITFSESHRKNLTEANRKRGLRVLEQHILNGKVCADCKQTKPVEEFYRYKRGDYYKYKSYCKECDGNRFKSWVSDPKNKEIIARRQKKKDPSITMEAVQENEGDKYMYYWTEDEVTEIEGA